MNTKQLKTRALNEWANGTTLLTAAIMTHLDVNAQEIVAGTMGLMLIIQSLLDIHVYQRKKAKSHK